MFTITEKAIAELKNILQSEGMPQQAAIRVFANSSGCCSTPRLGIEVADLSQTQAEPRDFDGLKVLVDPQAQHVADKATIDFYDNQEKPGFQVLWQQNDPAGNGCGCG